MNAVQEKIELLRTVALDEVAVDRMLDKLLHVVRGQYREKQDHYNRLLAEFESCYHLESAEFMRKFQAGELGDDMDYFEWSGLIEMREQVNRKLAQLQAH
ncbi:MAG: hypothetical protein KGZ83_00645 [Sulfuricella sp.]|nr:hypothetical protein [Sulfuricella sp.]